MHTRYTRSKQTRTCVVSPDIMIHSPYGIVERLQCELLCGIITRIPNGRDEVISIDFTPGLGMWR